VLWCRRRLSRRGTISIRADFSTAVSGKSPLLFRPGEYCETIKLNYTECSLYSIAFSTCARSSSAIDSIAVDGGIILPSMSHRSLATLYMTSWYRSRSVQMSRESLCVIIDQRRSLIMITGGTMSYLLAYRHRGERRGRRRRWILDRYSGHAKGQESYQSGASGSRLHGGQDATTSDCRLWEKSFGDRYFSLSLRDGKASSFPVVQWHQLTFGITRSCVYS
jgi:hypothetical protein